MGLYIFFEKEVEFGNHVFAQHDGQEFVESDVLNHGDGNVSCFLLVC